MHLVAPEPSLFVWTILSAVTIILLFAALLHFMLTNQIGVRKSFVWMAVIVFIPIVGPILYFKTAQRIKQLH